jgi:hypothetical protein
VFTLQGKAVEISFRDKMRGDIEDMDDAFREVYRTIKGRKKCLKSKHP